MDNDERNDGSKMDYATLISFARTWFPMVMSAIFATVTFILFQRQAKERKTQKDVNGIVQKTENREGVVNRCEGKSTGGCCKENGKVDSTLKILYGTNTGTAATFAKKLGAAAAASGIHVTDVSNVKDCDAEETFANADANSVLAIVISTFTDGSPPPDAVWFCTWLREAANDFRYQHSMLKNVRFCVFALGHSSYGDKAFCTGTQHSFHCSSVHIHRLKCKLLTMIDLQLVPSWTKIYPPSRANEF